MSIRGMVLTGIGTGESDAVPQIAGREVGRDDEWEVCPGGCIFAHGKVSFS